jgi:type I restriction enzyme S subunit
MKKGWEAKRISEIATHSLGKMLDKAKNRGEPKPYLRNLNVRWGEFDLSDLFEMRFLLEEAEKYTVVKGDVLICEGGYPGRAAIWDRDEPIYFQKALHRVRFHEPERNKWFVYYLQFRDLEGTLRKHFNGAGIQHFTGEALAQFEIPVPPLGEQQRIVGVLDEAFASLATAQAHAAQNLQNARDLFESHLNAVFTQRGEGWQLRRIPDVCVTFGRGKSRHRPRNEPCLYGGKYPFIQTGDISNADHVITTHTQTYNETGLAQSKLWPKGTVGIAIVGATIGETGVLDFEACFPDSVIGMTVNPAEADPFFLEYMLQHFKEMVKSHGEGSARENINLATFDRLLFPMPSVKEQRQIAAATDALKDQTKRLESIYQRKLAALDELKKSLLHQAFNGEL